MASTAVGDPIYPADFAAMLDYWTDYNPTWNATTTPSIGNGSLAGRYRKVGQTVDFTFQLTWGSTTSGATGTWLFNLPLISAFSTSPGYAFTAHANDANGNKYVLYCSLDNANRVLLYAAGGSTTVQATSPMTWATGDILRVSGTYELA